MVTPVRAGASILVLFPLLTGVLSGCSGSPDGVPDERSISLDTLFQVSLHETDSAFLGEAYVPSLSDEGLIILPDGYNNTIHLVAPDGTFQRSIGVPGEGPGEILAPHPVFSAGDDLFAVSHRNATISRFNLSNGEYLGRVRFPGRLRSVAPADDGTWWLGQWHPESGHAVVQWRPMEEVAGDPIFQLPRSVSRSIFLASVFGVPVVAAGDGMLASGFAGSDSIYVASTRGTTPVVTHRLALPVVRRRGGVETRSPPLDTQTSQEWANAYSALIAIGVVSRERLLVVHLDAIRHDGAVIENHWFVSVVDLDGEGCHDRSLPWAGDMVTTVHATGDTLVVVEEGVSDTGWDASRTVTGLRVDGSGCWDSVDPGS